LSVPKRARIRPMRSSICSSVTAGVVDGDLDVLEVGELEVGAHVHLGGELEVLPVVELVEVESSAWADDLDLVLLHGLAVEGRKRAVDRLFQRGAAAESAGR